MTDPLRILETCLYADDIAAAVDFYGRVLGLEEYSRTGDRHVFFRCGRQMLLVFAARYSDREGRGVPAHGARGPGHVAFSVTPAELDDWRRRLHDHDVAIETEMTWELGGRSIYVRDPAGNSVELVAGRVWDIPV